MLSPMENQEHLVDQLLGLLESTYQDKVSRIETHISTILLVSDKAYKIKKPVNFGFLDFSTLDKRRFYCEEELRLNQRLAPDLYEKVIPITGSMDQPQIHGNGEAIEYMVCMQRFDTRNQLDHLLRQNRLTIDHIDELAKTIASFHQSIPSAARDYPPAAPQAVFDAVMQNFEQLAPVIPLLDQQQQKQVQQLHDWSSEQNTLLREKLEQRLLQGHVKECHGDMHTGNITEINGKPVIFDGIEFNPAFRWIDVMSEMAFITMDLDFNGQLPFSYRLLNAYLEITGDYAGLELLRFYQVYRAMVRSKVTGLRLQQLADNSPEQAEQLDILKKYLGLAFGYIQPTRPIAAITMGVSGSGKSYVSMKMLQALQMIRIRSDVERKRLFPELAERYSENATAKTYQHLHHIAGLILQSGFNLVMDATYLKKQLRDDARSLAVKQQSLYMIIHLEDHEEILEKRIRERLKKKNNPSEATVDIMHKQLASQERLTEEEKPYAILLEENDRIIEKINAFLEQQS